MGMSTGEPTRKKTGKAVVRRTRVMSCMPPRIYAALDHHFVKAIETRYPPFLCVEILDISEVYPSELAMLKL